MTGFPAAKFGLKDRGVLREGARADLVVFDPETILDIGSYEAPKHPPSSNSERLWAPLGNCALPQSAIQVLQPATQLACYSRPE